MSIDSTPLIDSGMKVQSPRLNDSVPSAIVGAREAFLRDLPRLLDANRHQWVAYTASECIGIDPTSKARLIQECLRRGFARGTFLVCAVELQTPSEIDAI